jgi:hypothetical protein
MSESEHGTYAAAMRHNYYGTPKCPPCRRAVAEYVKARRKAKPDVYARERAESNLRVAAAWRLTLLYPAEFQVLVADERRARGLENHMDVVPGSPGAPRPAESDLTRERSDP